MNFIPSIYVSAQTVDNCTLFNATECGSLVQFLNEFLIPTLQTIAVAVAAIFMLVGAFKYITAGVEKDGQKAAQETLTNAAIGLVVALIVVVILNVVKSVVGVGSASFTGSPAPIITKL